MRVERTDDRIAVFEGDEILAKVDLHWINGYLHVESLEGTGSVEAVYALGRELQRLAQEGPVYFPLAEGMERTERERQLLSRIGARKIVEVWGLGDTEVFG